MSEESMLMPMERIQSAILQLRGDRVMLDTDLAILYGVEVRVLVQAVKRNIERFPDDFMFQLTAEEYAFLRSQIVTLNEGGRGKHRKYLPYAFTEQGVAMLSSVLRSPQAVQENATEQDFRQQCLQAFTDHKALDVMFDQVKALALRQGAAA